MSLVLNHSRQFPGKYVNLQWDFLFTVFMCFYCKRPNANADANANANAGETLFSFERWQTVFTLAWTALPFLETFFHTVEKSQANAPNVILHPLYSHLPAYHSILCYVDDRLMTFHKIHSADESDCSLNFSLSQGRRFLSLFTYIRPLKLFGINSSSCTGGDVTSNCCQYCEPIPSW